MAPTPLLAYSGAYPLRTRGKSRSLRTRERIARVLPVQTCDCTVYIYALLIQACLAYPGSLQENRIVVCILVETNRDRGRERERRVFYFISFFPKKKTHIIKQ